MTPQALTALKLSIAHWRRMAEGNRNKGDKPTGSQCALCIEFRKYSSCDGCPVQIHAGTHMCNCTPYYSAHIAYIDYGPKSPEFKAAARKELEFLESLLPKGEKP